MRTSLGLLLSASLWLVACGGGDSSSGDAPPASGGKGGAAGKSGAAGSAGSSAGQGGQAGSSAGKGGSAGGGQGGSSGKGGSGGSAGSSGAGNAGAGQGGSVAGDGGSAGDTQGGSAGDTQGGSAGDGGSAGSDQGGAAGDTQGGAAGDTQGGSSGDTQGGAAGDTQGGSAGDTQGGSAGDTQGGSAGDAGAGGDAGSAGDAGSGGSSGDCAGDPTIGQPCQTGLLGVCEVGMGACVSGVATCVNVALPHLEVCNGVDDDCDGQTDEDALGGGDPCTVPNKQGECAFGMTECSTGVVACASISGPSAEICDGKDNDCDGAIDDDPTDVGTGCDTGMPGVCQAGVQVCSNGALACQGLGTASAEVCDGLDNDCDGEADEDLAPLSCGLGECATEVPSCVGGKEQTCTPPKGSPETCDGKDNDCDGQTDEENVCCPVAQRCAAACCGASQVCSFQQCVDPGIECTASEDCPTGQYCEFSLGTVNQPPPGCQGAQQKTGKCLPKPPVCAGGQDPGDPPSCLVACEYKPPAPAFDPELKYSWGGQLVAPFASDVMMTPIVVQLDDDDCDGKVTERDIPEIVFSTFQSGAYNTNGTLHAISIIKGKVVDKWAVGGVHPTKQLAGGNLDGQPGSEIVACGPGNNEVKAFKPDGTLLWSAPSSQCFMPSIADLDQDGKPEVVTEEGIHNGQTGALKKAFSPPLNAPFILSDIDGDGMLDVVTSGKAYRGDGTLLVDTGLASGTMFQNTGDWKGPWAAVADLDLDGKPEVLGLDNVNHSLVIWRYNPAKASKFDVVRSGVDINGPLNPASCPSNSWGFTHGGGPVTVGDFNADGTPDVAFAGGVGYAVLDGKKLMNAAVGNAATFLWAKATTDCSSASTGSSLFDFNGDGKAEVIYSDQQRMRIYEGATGTILFETCNTTATLIENPIVADVDNDGQADIVVASNAYAGSNPGINCNNSTQSGIRVFSSKSGTFVRTRRIWNQHAYHVTNINEDGSVPAKEAANWTVPGLNNFRQNKQPAGEFAAPDLVVTLGPTCQGPYALVATVRNLGQAPVGAGVKVGFYSGGTKLGQLSTVTDLYPADSETLSLSLAQPPAGQVYAVVDDGSPAHPWHECRTDNNSSPPVGSTCSQ